MGPQLKKKIKKKYSIKKTVKKIDSKGCQVKKKNPDKGWCSLKIRHYC